MAKRLACIVEGQGDVEAVPIVVRRIAASCAPPLVVQVPSPIRIPKSRLVKDGELERAVGLAALQVKHNGGVLVILDSDDDCPATIGPQLLARASNVAGQVPVAVVLAKHEFEAWFIAAAESLRGHLGLPDDLAAPQDPELIQGAKEWLADRMAGSRSYSATLDQPTLAARFDLVAALRTDSFRKFHQEISRLLAESPDAW